MRSAHRWSGSRLVTTNTPQHFDKAFERRFQFRLQFNAPSEQARLQLVRDALPECKTDVLARIASDCNFTAAELQNVLRKLHIEKLCGNAVLDRASAIGELLRKDKQAKKRIGFRV